MNVYRRDNSLGVLSILLGIRSESSIKKSLINNSECIRFAKEERERERENEIEFSRRKILTNNWYGPESGYQPNYTNHS